MSHDELVLEMWASFDLEPDVDYVIRLRSMGLVPVQVVDIVFDANGAPHILHVKSRDQDAPIQVPWHAIEFYSRYPDVSRARLTADDLVDVGPCEICGANPGEICDFETHDDYFEEQGQR